jgi:hypothetical protein
VLADFEDSSHRPRILAEMGTFLVSKQTGTGLGGSGYLSAGKESRTGIATLQTST